MRRPLLILLALSGCASTSEPRAAVPEVVVSTVSARPAKTRTIIKVVEKDAPPCVTRSQIPDEPPRIEGKLTGLANFDVGPLAKSARDLRASLKRARDLLEDCAK